MKKQSWKDWFSEHGYLFISFVGYLLLAGLSWRFWNYLVSWDEKYPALVRGLAAPVIAAPIAIAALQLAARRTKEMNRQNEIAEQGNRIETFSRAVGQLGHEKQVVRQGAVAIFKQLGETALNKQEKEGVISMLASFVRNQAALPKKKEGEKNLPRAKYREKNLPPPKDRRERMDVEDAIKALAFITEGKEERRKVNLNSTDLRELLLSGLGEKANLSYFNLNIANLSCAWLQDADLSHTSFLFANLSDTELKGANLSGAILRGANLSLAQLQESENLTDDRLDHIRYYEDYPPILPFPLNLPKKENNIIQKGEMDYNEEELERLGGDDEAEDGNEE